MEIFNHMAVLMNVIQSSPTRNENKLVSKRQKRDAFDNRVWSEDEKKRRHAGLHLALEESECMDRQVVFKA